jgi:hypothetical protein
MSLDKERLLELKNIAVQNRQHYLDMVQQANGAIALLDVLLSEAEKTQGLDENQ